MPATSSERSLITRHDHELDVVISGRPDAPAFVFHMGTTHAVLPFPDALDPSQYGVRCIMYNRPGYGRSTPVPGRTAADAAGDVAAILDDLDISTFVTAGWSGGAPHALACAALLPGRCLATAVLGGIGPYDQDASLREIFTQIDEARPALNGDADGYERALSDGAAAVRDLDVPRVAAMFASPADRASINGELGDWVVESLTVGHSPTPAGVRDDYLAFMKPWGFDVAESRNVAIWHGEEDHIPLVHPRWIAAHAPDAELHILPAEGHMSMLLQLPRIVSDLLRRAEVAR